MKRSATIAWAAGAVVLAAALGVFWRPSSSDSPPSPAAAPGGGLEWGRGALQQYDVRVDSSLRASAGAAMPSQDLRVRINGTLDFRTLEADAAGARVGMRFSSIELEIGGASDTATNRALEAPFRVRFSSAGMPQSFEFPATVGAQERGILENLVRTFQVTLQGADDWTAQESNASGSYEAAYSRIAPSRVAKSKRLFAGDPALPAYAGAEIASTELLSVDAGSDWLVSMTVDETLSRRAQGGADLDVTNHATLELRSVAQRSSPPDVWEFVAAAASAAPDRPAMAMSPEQARSTMRGEIADLNAATEGRTPRIHRLRDLVRGDATLPAALLAHMQSEELTDRTRADLYLVLELAGTDAAQSALSSVVAGSAWSSRDSMRAVVALAGVANPSSETVATLWNAAQTNPSSEEGRQLASTATLALGSLGRAMSAGDGAAYSSLRSRLLAGAMSGAGVAERRVDYVHAVGNTRDATLARDIVVLLDDAEPAIRRAAALSLGRLDADQAADALLARFERERSSEVRAAIVESLAGWTAPTPAAAAAMRREIRAEADENARFQMARFLGASLAQFPDNRAVLEDVLRYEQSRRIRQQVGEALAAPQ